MVYDRVGRRLTLFLLAALALLLGAAPGRAGDTKGKEPKGGPPVPDRPLDEVFKGRIVKIKGNTVTIRYDFEDASQLEDFEAARPPRLLDASQNRVHVRGGRLVLEGSSAIRHKMEGKNRLHAKFRARVSKQSNVGTVFTPPILNDFYVVLNLFDERFYGNGGLILAGCGLKQDEGADVERELVNWRDIFRSDVRDEAKVGHEVEIEVWKDGWSEYCRVGEVEGKGSSKGKTAKMDSYKFGLWVHHSRMTVDDLVLTIELPDEYLDLNNLKAEIDEDAAMAPETGPLAGIEGVPPAVRERIEAYARGRGDPQGVAEILSRTGLPDEVREVAAKLLEQRRDPKCVRWVINALYAKDKKSRELAIGVVKVVTGKTFGYRARSSEKRRSAAIRKLNDYMQKHRSRFYG